MEWGVICSVLGVVVSMWKGLCSKSDAHFRAKQAVEAQSVLWHFSMKGRSPACPRLGLSLAWYDEKH